MPKGKVYIPKSSSSMMSPGSPGSPASPNLFNPGRVTPAAHVAASDPNKHSQPGKYFTDGSRKPFEGKEIHHNRTNLSGAYSSVTDFSSALNEDVFGKFFSTPEGPQDEQIPYESSHSEEHTPAPLYDNFTDVVRGDGFHFMSAAAAALDPFMGFGEEQQNESGLAALATKTLTAQKPRRGSIEYRPSMDTVGMALHSGKRRTSHRKTI